MAVAPSATVNTCTRPQFGDVLVSKLSARVDHQVGIVAVRPGPLCPNEASAIAEGTRLAREHRVDAWLTQDHRHYLKIACYRQPHIVDVDAFLADGPGAEPQGDPHDRHDSQ